MSKQKESKLEKDFQRNLIKELKSKFLGCVIMKNDPDYIQGIPDLLVLHKSKWAALECKKQINSRHQPNQDFYVDKMNNMSFARFVYPENKNQVVNELKLFFEVGGSLNEIQ